MFVFYLCTSHEMLIMMTNPPPVATLHLDDERQLYSRPSLLRTRGQESSVTVLSARPRRVTRDERCSLSSPCLLAEISAGCATFDM